MKTRKKTSGLILSLVMVLGIGIYSCDKDKDDNNNNNSNTVTQQDRTFARSANFSNNAEVELGRLALQRSSNDSVKAFARDMVGEHTKSKNQLDSIARGLSITLSDSLDAAHRTLNEKLTTLNDLAFDTVYINNQVKDLQATMSLLQNQIGNGKNNGLVKYATKNLPVVNRHLLRAKNLQTYLKQNSGGQ
jgi:putative membrane protein